MVSNLRNLLSRRNLVATLIVADLKSHSAETRLGALWWILHPVLMMGIYWLFMVLLFGRDTYHPYPVFVGCALVSWKHLTVSLNKAATCLYYRQALIKAISFPTMALPVSLVLAQFINFLGGLAVVIGIAILFEVPMGAHLIQLPPLMVCQIFIVTGVALAVACYGAVVRDLQEMLGHVLQIVWYLSPALYGIDLVAKQLADVQVGLGNLTLMDLYMLNPFAILFTGYRGALFEPQWLSPDLWSILMLESAAVCMAGYLVYRRFDDRVIKFI